MKESVLSKQITDFVMTHDGFVFNTTGSVYQKQGMPDLYIAHPYLVNKAMWLELKVGKNKLTKAQAYQIRELRRRGVLAGWLRFTVDDGYTFGYEPDGFSWIVRYGLFEDMWKYLLKARV